jgi:hypothetical protein
MKNSQFSQYRENLRRLAVVDRKIKVHEIYEDLERHVRNVDNLIKELDRAIERAK